jgi:competence protein ComGC
MTQRGLSRVELLLIFVLVGLVISISVPVFDSMIDRKHSAECRNNLMVIGQGVCAYVRDHDSRLPDLIAGRADRSQDVPVMETVLLPYVSGPEVFRCPADGRELYERSGSSYYWNYFPEFGEGGVKALHVEDCRISGVRPRSGEFTELVTDKEPFHRQRSSKNSIYLLGKPTFQ